MTALAVAAFQKDLVCEPTYSWGRLLALVEVLLTSTLIAYSFSPSGVNSAGERRHALTRSSHPPL